MLMPNRLAVTDIHKSFCRVASRFKTAQKSLLAILVIVATWLLGVVLIDPRGDFPLIDDWAYGGAVKILVETGSLRIPDWTSANLIAQMFWGALFCLPAGFSFTALRVSTLVFGLVGILAVYGLFREIGAARSVSLFGAILLAVNPLYLVLSYTFMTDVPFVTLCLLSIYFLARATRTDSSLEIVVGLLFGLVALLIRQVGMAIFVGASLACLSKHRFRTRTGLIAMVPLLLGVATQFLFQEWLKFTHRMPSVYQVQVRLLQYVLSHITWRTLISFVDASIVFLIYLGLFSLPFLMFLGPDRLKAIFRFRILTFATAFFAALSVFFLRNKRMPLLSDVFYNLGLGPPILYDTDTLHLRHTPTVGGWFWVLVTVAGAIGAIFLFQATLVAIVEECRPRPPVNARRPVTVLLLAIGMVYIAPLIVIWIYGFAFDRYLILLVPLVTLVFVQSSATSQRTKMDARFMIPAVLSLAICGTFSIAATHDYLSWNRVRWQALNNLMQEQHVLPKQIDGGFEFNPWYLYDRSSPNQELIYVDQLTHPERTEKIGVRPNSAKSWWWVDGDDFVVTLGLVPGYTEVKRYQFRRWLPPGDGSVLVLRRTGLDSTQ